MLALWGEPFGRSLDGKNNRLKAKNSVASFKMEFSVSTIKFKSKLHRPNLTPRAHVIVPATTINSG